MFAARRGAALRMLASRGVAESEGAEPWPRLSHFWAGAVGGTVGILATCPLEVIKTRAQSSHSRVGPSILSTLRYIARTEGMAGLWRGIGPSIGGVAPSRAIYFGCYSYFKDAIPEVGLAPGVRDFAAAAASGCTVATLTSPVWVLKTRIQLQSLRDPAVAQTNPRMRNYASYGDAVTRIFREEGMAGFYKGLTASYWNVIEGAIQLALYQRLKTVCRPWYGASPEGSRSGGAALLEEEEDLPKGQLFVLAAGAKLLASSLTYPLEVVRTRLREQRTAYGVDPKCARPYSLLAPTVPAGSLTPPTPPGTAAFPTACALWPPRRAGAASTEDSAPTCCASCPTQPSCTSWSRRWWASRCEGGRVLPCNERPSSVGGGPAVWQAVGAMPALSSAVGAPIFSSCMLL